MEGADRRFTKIYICYGALKEGWRKGCRPIIGLDGCHLKTVYKGQLLTAVGIDANNGMYPVAFAVVEKENKDAWIWFLKFLKDDLSMSNDYSYTKLPKSYYSNNKCGKCGQKGHNQRSCGKRNQPSSASEAVSN